MKKIIFSLALFFLAFSSDAFAALRTWDGGGADANWTTPANWVGDVAPVANDDLVFPAASAQQATNNSFPNATNFNSITFEGGSYTVSGNTFRLTSGLNVTGGLTHQINTGVTVNTAQTFNSSLTATTIIAFLTVGSGGLTFDGEGSFAIGLIGGTGTITKNGVGATLIASTLFGFSGAINLNNGVFVVDANLPNTVVNINSPTTTGGPLGFSGFGGTGTVSTTTVTQGVISAGTLDSPTGILNIRNNLTFSAGGNYICKIGGTTPGADGHDQLNVTGTVTLSGARLAPIPWGTFRPAIGDTFVILRNDGTDPINGTFANAPEGSVFSGPLNTAFRISYAGGDGNDVTITRVNKAAFDFDTDGKSDLSIFRPSTMDWWYQSSANGAQRAKRWGNATDLLAPADYDGDSRTDFAVFRPSEGVWYILNSLTETTTAVQFGASGDKPVPNDFDGDGRADIAVFRPSTGVWYELRSLTNQVFIQQFGINGDIPLLADYDGDGLGDLTVFRPADGVWHFWLSSTSSYTAFPFGASGDTPVPADYDGDGRTDAAIFRATADSNQPDFYILLTGPLTFQGASWGVPGDVPVVADYDGDGRADIAVFRPGTNEWFLLRSTAGFASFTFGLAGDKPVPGAFIQ